MSDGVTHINVYSKGKTELGRWLSNFSYAPFSTEHGQFASIEGYWYWLSCRDDRLRTLHGFTAKQLGRELRAPDWPVIPNFKDLIKKATRAKLEAHPVYAKMLAESTLPLKHYYVYAGKIVSVPNCDWLTVFLEELRLEFKLLGVT